MPPLFYFNSNILARDSDSKSPNMPRTNQKERRRATGKTSGSGMSGWGDGLVSLSFSNRLVKHQKKVTPEYTVPRQGGQAKRQHTKPKQRTQTQGRQQDQGAEPHVPRNRDRPNSDRAVKTSRQQTNRQQTNRQQTNRQQTNRQQPAANEEPKGASMTRPPQTRLNLHAPSQNGPAPSAEAKAVPASTSSAADRAVRLTALSGTNLTTLFHEHDTPVARTPLPAYAPTAARVRGVLERSAGDYSRFLPRSVGVRKSASRPPALRTARHALAAQRDVSLSQRAIALHIIGGLTQPRRQVSA